MSKEFSRTILGPCCRDGKDGDWWREQHKDCTGSHHLPGGDYVTCTCSCHTRTTQEVIILTAEGHFTQTVTGLSGTESA